MDLLVSTEELAARIGQPDLRLLDATYFALEPERDAAAHFAAGHLPGARFLDLEHLADPTHPAPFMLPSAELIADRLSALGIAADHEIILYDDAPHHTAARAWWMLRQCGAERVRLLDGGLAKWVREGRPIEVGGSADPDRAVFAVRGERTGVRTKADMLALLASGGTQIVDARSPARFRGDEADPRPGVAPGHIPGSLNLRYGALFEEDGTWKRGAALRAAFTDAGVDPDRPVVTTCGSGVTAAILLFGLALLGGPEGGLYDGSWSEWGADPATPKALGA